MNYSKSNNNNFIDCMWKWFGNGYKVQCTSRTDYDKMLSWKNSRKGFGSTDREGNIAYDVIIPEEYKERVIKLLHLIRIGKDDYEAKEEA